MTSNPGIREQRQLSKHSVYIIYTPGKPDMSKGTPISKIHIIIIFNNICPGYSYAK
jgi:hypothetical protein